MAVVVEVPTGSPICEILSQMNDKDIVLATSEDDFRDWSSCEIGAKIAANPAMVGDNYDYLVRNRDTDCIERYPKPAPPVYDSALLKPWMANKYWSGTFPATTGYIANQSLDLPVFGVDVNILAQYTIATQGNAIEWTPGGPIQTPGATLGTGYEGYDTLPVTVDSGAVGDYYSRTYCRKVFVKAGQSGLKIAIYLWNGGGMGWGHWGVVGFTSINAIAFKA
jgi:hypothetical protein